MTYNPMGSLMLSLIVFLIVVLLCLKDKKEELSTGGNGITIEGMFCLASALYWMGEKEAEEQLLLSRYKKKTIY